MCAYKDLTDRDDLEDALYPYLRQIRLAPHDDEEDEDWDESDCFRD